MLTINLQEELKQLSRQRKADDDKFLSDSPQGIEYLKHRDSKTEMLKHFGTAVVIKEIDDRLKNLVAMKEKFGDNYSNFYTIEDIKNLCIKYRLRFLPSKLFKGNIDGEVLEKMQAFEDSDMFRTKIHKEGSQNETYYYIVAPSKSFELQKKPKDPLLFCYAGDGLWYLVCKWGNDLSFTRLIYGTITKYLKFSLSIGILSILIAYCMLCNMIFKPNSAEWVGIGFIGFILFLIIILIINIGVEPKDNYKIWDSPYK